MVFSNNLKYLRKGKQPKVTQSEMAELLGVSVSTYGAYEEGRAEPRLENLQKLALFFKITMDALLQHDFSENSKVPETEGSFKTKGPEVIVTTIDAKGKDNIEWVSAKAAAGYTAGYGDPDFVQQLPVFQVPFLDQSKKYRLFTIEGDSMLPIPSGAHIFAELIADWSQLKDDSLCVVVTRSDGIVFKRIKNYLRKQGCLLLISSNTFYDPYVVSAGDIMEIWKFSGFFSHQFPSD